MIIKTKISFNDYLKLLLKLTYRKPIMIIVITVAVSTLIWISSYDFHIFHFSKPTFYQYILLSIILIIQPLAIFFTIRRNYYSSSFLMETLRIEFTKEQIKITGDSFYMEFAWKKVYKIQELKKYFLIYQNNLSAIIIEKASLDQHVEEFRKFFNAIPPKSVHIKNNAETN